MKCSGFIAVTVDGFIARPDGALDWLERVARPGEDYGYARFAASVDTVVVGRGTYDAVLGFPEWPWAGKRVVVLTHRPAAPRAGETFSAEPPAALAARLAAEGAEHVYVDGGHVLRQFLAADHLDALTLSVIPTLLGRGIPLFGPGTPERTLTLESTEAFPSGLVQIRYRRP